MKMDIFNYSKEKLKELSLSDLISLKAYLVNDCIAPWKKLISKAKIKDEIEDYQKRTDFCEKLKELVEDTIADRLLQIAPYNHL